MASFLRQLIPSSIRLFASPSRRAFKVTGLVVLGLVTLSACGRAGYIFSPSPHAYLVAAPSGPASASAPRASALAAAPSPTTNKRYWRLARRAAKKPRFSVAKRDAPRPAQAPLVLAKFLLTKHISRAGTSLHHPTYSDGATDKSSKLATSLALIGGGLAALLLGIRISALVLLGPLFGTLFIVVGSVAIAVGLILLLAAFNIKE
jgi:hypothetical protein